MITSEQHMGITEEQATGCIGAGSYLDYAKERGYTHIEVLDWTSSAGDWSFIISKDGERWYVLHQENNWPNAGFSHHIEEGAWFGIAEQVVGAICAYWEGETE